MSQHPLIEKSNDREVKQATGFKQAAASLKGEELAELYEREHANAPKRVDAGKKYFVSHNTQLASVRRPGRDGEHASIALVQYCRASGGGVAIPENVLSEDTPEAMLRFVHPLVPLRSAQPAKALGADDPNYGIDRIDLVGVAPGDRLAVVSVRFLAPDVKRVGVGDTPLRALLQGLANCAIASANLDTLKVEIASAGGGAVVDEPPILVLLGSPRYWELCRKREAQKGAVWIRELQRLATEIERDIGVTVMYLGLQLEGNPGFSYPEDSPQLDAPPRLAVAWERNAGRVKPKAKPRARKQDPANVIIEPDMSRPIRRYAISDTFQAGDRIDHPTLGSGVVQGEAGHGKINVLFGEKKSLLVHERGASPPA